MNYCGSDQHQKRRVKYTMLQDCKKVLKNAFIEIHNAFFPCGKRFFQYLKKSLYVYGSLEMLNGTAPGLSHKISVGWDGMQKKGMGVFPIASVPFLKHL